MERSCRYLRALVSGLAFLFCIGILVSLAIETGAPQAAKATSPLASTSTLRSLVDLKELRSREKPIGQMKLDPFHNSKRRVPNGPDPIHNRRARKSARSPGKA